MSYTSTVLADNPIGYWKLDDTGSTAVDSSSNGRDLTINSGNGTNQGVTTGAASLLTNLPTGAACVFDQSETIFNYFSNLPTTTFTDGVTIEAWIKFNQLPTSAFNFVGAGTGTSVSVNTAGIGLQTSGRLRVALNNSTTSLSVATPALAVDTVYHVVYSVEVSGGNWTRIVYLDGTAINTSTGVAAAITSATKFGIGNGLANGTTITIDEVALYDYGLTSTQVSDHYDAGIASPNVAPANTAAPTLSGTAKVGQTLTTTDGTWTGTPTPTYAYKWQVSDNGTSGWSDISGATSSTFTLTSSQSGKYARSQVTATNSEGSLAAESSATAQIVEDPAIDTPTISGTAKVGQTLTASASATAGFPAPSISYAWESSADGSSWSAISGETASTLLIDSSLAGLYIRVEATATNSEGTDTELSTATAQVVQDPVVDTPSVTGQTKVGQTLTATANATEGFPSPSISYIWKRANTAGGSYTTISGATSSSYVLQSADLDKYIKVEATATNSEGTDSQLSSALGPITQDAPPPPSGDPNATGAIIGALTAIRGF